MNKGFSTLEMLIAMMILTLSLGAVVMVSFSNQSILVDSEMSANALTKAQESLEAMQALARKDFKLVNPIAPVTVAPFTTTVSVESQPDFFSKKITATVTWVGEHLRPQQTVLTSFVSNFENPVGADTCSSVLTGDWTNPQVKNGTTDFGTLVGDAGGTYQIGDIDVYLKKMYVVASSAANSTAKTFFTFDVTDPASPVLDTQKSIDNDDTSSAGINGVVIAGRYAYVASARPANFNTISPLTPCNNNAGANQSCGQLQVIDLGVSPASVIYTLVTPAVGSLGQAIGESIFYKDGFIYLGLAQAASGPEFNIIDVHNPTAPIWIGGVHVGSAVNAIVVRATSEGTFAYIATPNNILNAPASNYDEISVINVSNPVSPFYVSGFVGKDDSGNGKSMYAVGDNLYVGETFTASAEELFKLDSSDPAHFLSKNPYPLANTSLFAKEIGSSVNGLIVRDYLAMLGTTGGQFQVWNIANPASVSLYDTSPISVNGSVRAMDCEANTIYVGSNQTKGFFYAISP